VQLMQDYFASHCRTHPVPHSSSLNFHKMSLMIASATVKQLIIALLRFTPVLSSLLLAAKQKYITFM